MKILCKWCEKIFDEEMIVFLPGAHLSIYLGDTYVCLECYKKHYEKKKKKEVII